MPDRTYRLVYVVDDAGATPKLEGIRKGIVSVDYAARGGKKGIDDLAASMANLNASVQGVGTNLPGLQGQIAGVQAKTKDVKHENESLVTSWQAWEVGVAAAQKFGEYVNTAREMMRELAKETIKTRDHFRELANLQGHEGPDDEVLARNIELGVKAGMMPDETAEFMEQFEGSIPAGRTKGNIQKGTESPLAIEGMKFGTRVRLNPRTAGDLAGVLPQYGKINSAEQGAGQMGAIAHGLNEGRGNLEPLVRSLIKTAGSLVEEHGGAVDDLPELAAILGVASTNATPDRAGTMVQNAVRGLRQFSYKAQTEDEKRLNAPRKLKAQGQALADMGINPQMKFRQALDQIAPRIRAADADGTGGDVYLRQQGFDNEDEIRALVQLSRNIDVVHERIKAAKTAGRGADVMRANDRFLNDNKTGINRQVQAQKKAQEFLAGNPLEYSEMARQAGNTRRLSDHKTGTARAIGNFIMDAGGLLPLLGAEKTSDQRDKVAFMEQLKEEGDRVGVDVKKLFRDRFKKLSAAQQTKIKSLGLPAQFDDTAGLNQVIQAVIDKGGRPFGDGKKIQANLERTAQQGSKEAMARAQARAGGPRPGDAAGKNVGLGPGAGADMRRQIQQMVDEQKKTNQLLGRNPANPVAPAPRRIAPGRK